ncbi:MAG: PAS domain S-box protein, partial [Flavobacteriales bacterium]|nr:PAS domain S-box protein [Flavobacteriales bacterium]
EVVFQISQAVVVTSDIKGLIGIVHKQLNELINAENFYVALYDQKTDSYTFPYCVDQYDQGADNSKLNLAKSLTDYVRRLGKPLLANEARHNKLIKKGEVEMVGTPSEVWLGAPLKTSRGIIGVVAVQSYVDCNMYSKEDLELLVFVSGQIARVIEQRQTDESIRLSEKRFRDLFEGSPDAIFVESLEGVVLDANPAASEMHGLPYSEIVGNSFLNLIPGDLRGEIKTNFENFFEQGLVSLESQSLKKNGKIIPVEIKVNHIDYGGKEVLLLHVRDISSRKEAEEKLQNSHEQLRQLSAHLQSIKEEESKRIARDLHDSLGQILTALKFDISMLDRQLEEQVPSNKEFKPLKEKTKSMISKVDTTIEAMRRISANLRPVVLDDIGLNAALEWLAGDFRKRTKINCAINLSSEDELVSDKEVATSLYRIIQEAFTNIIRHAKARNVALSLIRDSKNIVLTVGDDGKGMIKGELKKTTSFGLLGIKERVRGLGGTFEIIGKEGVGTTMKVVIPITN